MKLFLGYCKRLSYVHGRRPFIKGASMSTFQLETLIKDSKKLSQYILKMERKGNNTLVTKLRKKQEFLDNFIAEHSHQHA